MVTSPLPYCSLFQRTESSLALHRKWANVSPSDPNATKHDWLQCALSSPVAFYALSFAASQHLNYLNLGIDKTANADLLRLSYKTEAVKLINRALTNLDGAPVPDSLLIAILSLGAHGHKPVPHSGAATSDTELKYRGPKSPLASAQMLDFYGHIDQETAHMSALRTLLAHNKGVGGIKLAGLAGALALGDLLHSTITHQKPSLNVTTPVREIAAVAQFLPDEDCPDGRHRFPVKLTSLPTFKSTSTLLRAMTAARAVTAALNHHQHPDGSGERDDILHISEKSLVLARNDVHHSLLGLPVANSLWGQEFALYELVRVAGLIYSDLVLFPLPAETGVRGRYAKTMREGMEGGRVEGVGREEAGVVMWGCLLGAAAAAETRDGVFVHAEVDESATKDIRLGDRDWFVGKVRMCAETLGVGLRQGVKGWTEVREKVCRRYLWWDDVCDPVGGAVWEDVMALQSAVLSLDVQNMVVAGKQEGGDRPWP